jgi:hypothetical protein
MSMAIWHEFRHHVRCILTVPFGGSFKEIKTKWVFQTKRTFDDKTGGKPHTYNLDLDEAIFSKKNHPKIYYEVGKTNPIPMKSKRGVGKSSNLYNTILKDESAEDVLSESRSKSMLIIIGVLIIIIVGIGIYSQYQLGIANDKVVELSTRMAGIIANITRTGGVIIR